MNRTNAPAVPVAGFVKIGADGAQLDAAATEWAAVLDTRTDLIWSAHETKQMTWSQAKKHCAQLELAGAKDWRLPTVEELFLLADRTRHSPAIDTNYFPACNSSWYWTSTPDAEAPGEYAWFVNFYDGYASYGLQYSGGRVRAVRPRQ